MPPCSESSSLRQVSYFTRSRGDGLRHTLRKASKRYLFNGLRTGELQKIPFVTVNNKKLYVQRTINANTDARTFIEHVTQVIKGKQANPDGQEADVAEHHEKLLDYLDNLTPDLKTDLYIELNKEKKKKRDPKGKGKGKLKTRMSRRNPVPSGTNDYPTLRRGEINKLIDVVPLKKLDEQLKGVSEFAKHFQEVLNRSASSVDEKIAAV
ncbi:hypothetical protein Neosp_002333 [[Neocosmospora] mangrovei]